MNGEHGLLRVLSNEQVDRMGAESSKVVQELNPNDQLVSGLCSYIESCWEHAKSAKTEVEREMVEALYRRAGKYSPEKQSEINREGQPLIFMNITGNKCRAAEGWLMDIAMPDGGERPFSIEPSPVPTVPPEVKKQIQDMLIIQMQEMVMSGAVVDVRQMPALQEELERKLVQGVKQEAMKRAEAMEDQIDDLASEGDWYQAIEDCIPHLVTHHNCFLKGPIITRKKVLSYVLTTASPDVHVPIVRDKLIPTFYAVDPTNIYPSANSRNVQDGFMFEKIPLRRGALYDCIGSPGFDEDRLRAALDEYGDGHALMTSVASDLRVIDKMHNQLMSPDQPIDVLEFHGALSGRVLHEWGKTDCDALASYEVRAWKVGRFVVYASINEHPTGRRPYESASIDRRANAFWGWGGIPHIIKDLQDVCNACARSLVFNMAIGSGPQVQVNVDRLAEGEVIDQVRPWRIWQTKESKHPTSSQKAVDFFVPDSVASVLQSVYEYFSSKADEYSGIPSYATGIPTNKGAAGTASGMSMLMGQATRQMKRIVAGVDRMVEGSITALHLHEMLYGENRACKGDSWVRARGSSALMVREQNQMRLNEALQMTANPIDMSIMGPEGRAEMLRALIKDFDLQVDNVIPDRAEILAKAQAAMMAEVEQQQAGNVERGKESAPDGSPAGGRAANTVQ